MFKGKLHCLGMIKKYETVERILGTSQTTKNTRSLVLKKLYLETCQLNLIEICLLDSLFYRQLANFVSSFLKINVCTTY